MGEREEGGAFNIRRVIEDDEAFITIPRHFHGFVAQGAAGFLAVAIAQDHQHAGGRVAEAVIAPITLLGDFEPASSIVGLRHQRQEPDE